MWQYTVRYYFDGEDEAYVDGIIRKAAIICYTRLLRWYGTKKSKDDAEAQQVIAFCENYLTENVPKTDTLYF